MADSFQMDPQRTGSGLTGAGRSRSAPATRAVPALPMGNYITSYSTTATEILATLSGQLVVDVGFGVTNAGTSVTRTETTEAANQASLAR